VISAADGRKDGIRKTKDGRPYCLLIQQDGSGTIEVHPDVWDALKLMVRCQTGEIRIGFQEGNCTGAYLNNVSVRALRG
jgi:hypothetical protein